MTRQAWVIKMVLEYHNMQLTAEDFFFLLIGTLKKNEISGYVLNLIIP